jgi:predicted HicB family RNase H-like nuclease
VSRRIAPTGERPVDLQVCVQASLDAAIGLAADAEALRRPQWIRKVLTRAAGAPHTGPAPRSSVRLRDGDGRLADDAGLMRALGRLDPGRAVPNSGRSRVLRIRIPPQLDAAIDVAARVEHQPHGDWIRTQLTKAATWRLNRVREHAAAGRA